ncbi:hypothetical protein V1281_000479 [Nitrobacteraceae bacterium AZCC 2161]
MNGPFQVAQATGTGTSSNSAPPRIFKLTKPLGDQAVVVNLGYDQKVQVDFSGIANEKITLVHVGEKLIVLFDNKSTVTVEPFFDSRHDQAQNLTVEIAPGRDVSVSEFASLFPITTDQSVLPAAGEGNGNAQASGANFSNSSVDPLAAGNPLDLLGQEELGTFAVPPPVNPVLPTDTTVVAATVNLSASTVLEGAVANYTFTATLTNPSHGTTTVTTDQGVITITDGNTTGTLVLVSGNGDDVYLDASQLTATITSATGGNFENLVVGTAAATAHVNDTIDTTTVNLSASTVLEGAVANYTFTATLTNPSHGTTTVTTDQGVITITDGNTTGTLVLVSGNGPDVYLDASQLTATITSATGGNFENLVVGTAAATAHVNDTIDTTTVNLSASTVLEGAVANYTFTATLTNPSHGTTTVTTDQGVITITDGNTTGTLVLVSGNGPDVYLDASQLTATITSATGGNFENLVVGTAAATAHVNDTIDTTTVNLSASTVLEGAVANYTFTATLTNPSHGTTTVTTDQGVITITDGNTTGTLVLVSGNGPDVYLDASQLTATITSATGGNFENLVVGTAAATAHVNDTIDTTTVNLSASTVLEGAVANYTFTATLTNPSHGTTTVTTDQGVITITDGNTAGTLVLVSGNGDDVYLDASQLTATITSATGGNFENLVVGTAAATAHVNDTIDTTTVNLSASTVLEGAVANYTFTATLTNPSHGTTTVTTDQGVITITDGNTTGTLVLVSGNGPDVYLDASQLTATITSATGGNFENLVVGTAAATAHVNDTIDTTTVNLSASTVLEGAVANYTFTATLTNPSHGTTTVTTDQGVITITDGNTTGTLVLVSGNGDDVYLDASQLTATITSATGGNFENLVVGTAAATAHVNDTIDTTTVNLSASTVLEGAVANYTFTATLTNPSHGTTTVTTDQGVITITDGNTAGTLVLVSGNGPDVYLDASQLTATITSATGGNFENLVVGTAAATAHVNDTIDTTTVNLSASTVLEGAVANYTFTATLTNPSHGTTTVTTDQGVITITDGNTTGTLVLVSGNGDDVYLDASQLTATITSATGGNFENLVVGTAAATAHVNDTIDTTTVNLSASTVLEGAVANYTFTATLTNPSHGTTTVTTDQGVITITDGNTTGTLVLVSGNGPDVYLDASQLTATITSATGGNFENLVVGTAAATAHVNDTIDTTTVNLSASTVLEGAVANYTFTATLTNPSHGTTTVTTDQGVITITDGNTTGTLVLVSGNGDDVYLDASQLTATITSATGGNFENLVVGTAAATAHVNDTIDTTTVNLSASTVLEGAVANYTFTATLTNPSHGTTTVTTDQGVITITDGNTTGTLVLVSGNGDDVYLDASQLTATITSATGGNFENLVVGTAAATAHVNDTIDTTTVNLSASTVLEGAVANYTFTATLTNPSHGTTTVTTDQGVITITDGNTTGTLVLVSGNGPDVYLDASQLTATITSATGGNFENLVVGTAAATAHVNDTIDTTTVNLSASTVLEGAVANYTFTATLTNPSHGTTTVTTDQGVITITDGNTTGTLVLVSGNGDDVYLDASQLTATITSATGGNFENLVIGTAGATAHVNDTTNAVTATLTSSTAGISEFGGSINYTVTLTGSPGSVAPTSNLVFTLANGEHVTILAGATSGSVTTSYTDAQITNQASITDSIVSVFSGGTEYEQLLETGSTSVPVVYAPTVAVGANNCLPEDTQEAIQFTATPSDANSHITQITVSGLTGGWTVDTALAHIAITGGGTIFGANFTVGGVLTLDISGAPAGAAQTAAVLMTPPVNSDADAHVTMTATAVEGAITVGSLGTAGTVYVDAVADMPTAQIVVTDSADAGVSFSNGETGALEVKATFGDYIDGSETHTITVTLQPGFLATELNGAPGPHHGWTHNGVTYNLDYTYTPTNGTTSGTIVVTIPDNMTSLDNSAVNNPNDNSGNVDLLFAVQAPAAGTLPDPLNFSMAANATETPTDGGCGPGNIDIVLGNSADNTASASASTGIPSTHLLSGSIVTNSNSSAQDMILTFVDQEHPLDAFSQLVVTNAQGQQGNVTSDSGFNINASDHFLVSLDSPFETTKIIVTNFTLNGTTMIPSSGSNFQLETNSGGPTHDGFTAVMQTNHPAVTGINSNDSHTNNASISDPAANNGSYNMSYVDGSNATATGSNDTDLLSGAGANNHLIGGAGNDIFVYRPTDIQIDGGTGFDILRVDQGAIYNSSLEITGASNNGLSAANAHTTVAGDHLYSVDFSATAGLTNMEAILLTEEPIASSVYGTELLGLTGAQVIAFTGGVGAINGQTGTANTLFIIGSPGDDVELSGWTEQPAAINNASSGGQVFHEWTTSVSGHTATLFIDNDLQVNHAAQ